MDIKKRERRSRRGTGEKVGLAFLAENAPDARMRFLAGLAARGGITQKELGRRYAAHNETAWSSSSMVQTHFLAERPRTVDSYAAVLGVPDEVLNLAAGKPMDSKAAHYWEREVLELLVGFQTDFQPNAVTAVKSALRDPETRDRALHAYALSSKNWLRASAGWSSVPETFAAFAEALYPRLDLRDLVAKRSSENGALWMIYTEAEKLYGSEPKAKALIDVIEAILRLDGFETRPMREFLEAQTESIEALAARHHRLAVRKE